MVSAQLGAVLKKRTPEPNLFGLQRPPIRLQKVIVWVCTVLPGTARCTNPTGYPLIRVCTEETLDKVGDHILLCLWGASCQKIGVGDIPAPQVLPQLLDSGFLVPSLPIHKFTPTQSKPPCCWPSKQAKTSAKMRA